MNRLADYFLLEMQDETARFIAVAGLRTRRVSFQAQPLNRLDFAAAGWRHLQAQSGPRTLEISGSGLFAGDAADHLMQQLFVLSRHAEARITLPAFGIFHGSFAITELAYEGRDGELMSWHIALQSAGEVNFALA